MEKKEILPLVFAQLFLFVFIQKYLFGINAYGTPEMSLYSYYGTFLVCLALFILGYALFSARDAAKLPSRKLVLLAGMLSVPLSICLLFDVIDFFPSGTRFGMLLVCLVLLALTFCIIEFAWLNRYKQAAAAFGSGNILLCILASAFIYSMITPSDVNESIYMLVLETISLPVASICYLIPREGSPARQYSSKHIDRNGISYLVSAMLFLFVMLLISYVDVLNLGYPEKHYENPTFYALLLVSIGVIVALFYRGGSKDRSLSDMTQNLISFSCVFFLLTYIIVFFFAASSYPFCFQFTCFARRLVAILFFVVMLSLTFIYDFKIEISIGAMFLVPYFLAKSLMMFAYMPVKTGAFDDIVDFRLVVLLVLGIMLVLFASFYWYFYGRENEISQIFRSVSQTGHNPSSAVTRQSVVVSFSEEYSLSEREEEVLYYLSMGYSNSRIAQLLCIADNTVGTHVQSIYKKVNLHSKQDVIDAVNRQLETR